MMNLRSRRIAKGKDNFYQVYAKPFFEAGLLKEIYVSDEISICNICDGGYCVFSFDQMRRKMPLGVVTDAQNAEYLMKLKNGFDLYCSRLNERGLLIPAAFVLDEEHLTAFKKLKQETLETGPKMDKEEEKRLIALANKMMKKK